MEKPISQQSDRKCVEDPCIWWCAQGKCRPRGHKGFKESPMLGNRALRVAKAVLGDAGHTARYRSSSATTFRRWNPYFTHPVLFPVQDTLQTYLLENSFSIYLQCRNASKQHLFCSLSSLCTISNSQQFRKIEGLIQKDANSVISTCKRPLCGHFQISGLRSFRYTQSVIANAFCKP